VQQQLGVVRGVLDEEHAQRSSHPHHPIEHRRHNAKHKRARCLPKPH
jgi:hypothetical protein